MQRVKARKSLSSIYLPLSNYYQLLVLNLHQYASYGCDFHEVMTASLILRLLPSFRHIYKPQAWLHSGITVLHASKEVLTYLQSFTNDCMN